MNNTMLIKLTELGVKTTDWVELNTQGALNYVKLPASVGVIDASGCMQNVKLLNTLEDLQGYYNRLRKCYGDNTSILAITDCSVSVSPIEVTIYKDRYVVSEPVAQGSLDTLEEVVSIIQKNILGLSEASHSLRILCDPMDNMCVVDIA